MKSEEAKRLKQLEDENRRLKQIVADKAVEIQVLTHLCGRACSPSGPTTHRARIRRADLAGIVCLHHALLTGRRLQVHRLRISAIFQATLKFRTGPGLC